MTLQNLRDVCLCNVIVSAYLIGRLRSQCQTSLGLFRQRFLCQIIYYENYSSMKDVMIQANKCGGWYSPFFFIAPHKMSFDQTKAEDSSFC